MAGKTKKLSTNPKAADKRAQQAANKASAAHAEAKAKEDAYWDAHANPVNKRDVKKQQQAAAAEQAAKKKAELAALKKAEEAEMAGVGKAKKQNAGTKVTRREIDAHKAKLQAQVDASAEQARMASRKTVGVEQYEAMLDVRVDNKMEHVVEARTLDEAVRQMSGLGVNDDGAGAGATDRHPEKRAKAMFNAYFERRLPEMKEEKPGLKLMAYKSKIFDEWQKSPENPRNWPKAE